MRKLLGCVISLLFGVSVFAQDYYTGKSRVSADGIITFSVKDSYGTVILLSNITNTRGTGRLIYKDGSPVEAEFEEVVDMTTSPGSIIKAFTETFTKEEYEVLRADSEAIIDVYYVISPEGNVEEVSFVFSKRPVLVAIPPSKFALLEKNLKRYVKCEVNLFGRKLKFVRGSGVANFSKANLQYPASPPEPENPDILLPTGPIDPADGVHHPAPWSRSLVN